MKGFCVFTQAEQDGKNKAKEGGVDIAIDLCPGWSAFVSSEQTRGGGGVEGVVAPAGEAEEGIEKLRSPTRAKKKTERKNIDGKMNKAIYGGQNKKFNK